MRSWGIILLVVAGPLLSACETFDGIFGSDEPPPLPGERIAVLGAERSVSPDPDVAGLTVVLPPVRQNSNWLGVGYIDQDTAVMHAALARNPKIAWSRSIGRGRDDEVRLVSAPIAADGVVYVIDATDRISALELSSGRTLWQVDLEAPEDDGYFGGGLAIFGDRLYATTGFGHVYALSRQSGEVLWESALDAPIRGAPAASADRVFTVTLDNRLVALSAEEGSQEWDFIGSEEIAGILGAASPTLIGRVVVAPFTTGEVVALAVNSGRQVWSDTLADFLRTAQTEDIAHVRATPVTADGFVYAMSNSGRMVAFEGRRGLRAWDRQIGGISTPWIAGDFIFLVTNEAELVAITRQRGQVLWVEALPKFEDPEDLEGPIVWYGPVLAGDQLWILNSLGEAWVHSPLDGSFTRSQKLASGFSVPPIVVGETLLILDDNANLIALR